MFSKKNEPPDSLHCRAVRSFRNQKRIRKNERNFPYPLFRFCNVDLWDHVQSNCLPLA